ncbi:MAG TPA: DNA-binding domain-containing protein [Rectinemataceae bacterium]|nr:DNA-binding domain-containing protein [Rectinemataceae bacterium]
MSLKIMVLKNHLATCKDPYIVRSGTPVVTVEFDEFLTIMARGRTTLTKTEVSGAMQLYKEELIRLLSEGQAVKTPTGTFYFGASGSLASIDDSFLPGSSATNHGIRLHHKPDRAFEDAAKLELSTERDERPDLSIPVLNTVIAAGEGQPDSPLHVADTAEIKGLRLRFDAADATQGLFFVDQGGAESRSPRYSLILPGTVHALVPAGLAPGDYKVKLRAAVNGKDVTEGVYKGVVRVEA